jgi:hypothetical protein
VISAYKYTHNQYLEKCPRQNPFISGVAMLSAKAICPVCSCPVNIKKYGYGWIDIRCREIIYNSDLPPFDILADPSMNIFSDQQGFRSIIKEVKITRRVHELVTVHLKLSVPYFCHNLYSKIKIQHHARFHPVALEVN